MPVCLHCGELAPEGALFCGKCGYTLPQPGLPSAAPSAPSAAPPAPAPRSLTPAGFVAPAAVMPPRAGAGFPPGGTYAVPAGAVPGAVGPMPPPPNAKYCRHCAAVISVAAAYCPVCQQPQG